MRISSRAIIINDKKILLMFRRKMKEGKLKEYFVIPGGGLEDGETLEENVVRELREEMNVDVKILGYLGFKQDENNKQHYFHCEIVNGEPYLGGEELERMTKENYYEPIYVDLKNIKHIDLIGAEFIKKAITKDYINNVKN